MSALMTEDRSRTDGQTQLQVHAGQMTIGEAVVAAAGQSTTVQTELTGIRTGFNEILFKYEIMRNQESSQSQKPNQEETPFVKTNMPETGESGVMDVGGGVDPLGIGVAHISRVCSKVSATAAATTGS